MYSRSIIPNEFNTPTEYITEKFVLRPLTIEYVEEDYEVVMSSVDHLYKLMDNSEWPFTVIHQFIKMIYTTHYYFVVFFYILYCEWT